MRQTPAGFCFAVKSSRYLTHMKRLTDLDRGVQRLYEPLEPLPPRAGSGPMLWQLPPNFHRDDERLALALDRLPAGRHTFEFRHPSWFCDEVYELLRWHGVALTIADRPGVGLPDARDHGGLHVRALPLRPSRAARQLLADRAARVGARGSPRGARSVDVYAYFNNDWEVFAPRNA